MNKRGIRRADKSVLPPARARMKATKGLGFDAALFHEKGMGRTRKAFVPFPFGGVVVTKIEY